MTAPADLRAACERCDDPACDVPASAAAYYSLDFATAPKGVIAAARDRNGEAHDECYTRKAKDWRAEAMELRADLVALQREADRLRHGEAIEGDFVCPGEFYRATVDPLIEAVREAMAQREGRTDAVRALLALLAATRKEADRG